MEGVQGFVTVGTALLVCASPPESSLRCSWVFSIMKAVELLDVLCDWHSRKVSASWWICDLGRPSLEIDTWKVRALVAL